ncbi:MAG TPA: restriction endonuclease subunit S [Mollicutes bacterium]|nr:restriction endonuclease subunit S [Mollicutes bacterium]
MRFNKVKFKDFIKFNPKRSLTRGEVSKKIAMENIEPYTKNISKYEIAEYNGGTKFKNEDTLVARITPSLENGKTAFVNILNDGEVAFGSTEFIVLTNIENVTTKEFIYYFSTTEYFRKPAISSMTGTSGRQRVQTDALYDLEYKLPDIKTQNFITNILSSLDDKIELNNKINNNLEELAQTLYKHWFVDFEFPNEEGLPYKSSGGEMVDSELGMIPKGWKIEFLGSSRLTKLMKSGILRFDGSKKYIATADVSDTSITSFSTKITFDERPSRANMQPKINSVWFAKMKDSRKLIRVSENSSYLLSKCIFSTGFAGIETINSLNYIWTYLISTDFDETKNNLCNGTTMQAINNDNIKRIRILSPNIHVLKMYEDLVQPLFDLVESNSIQNDKLAKTRDELLPKLMSGEIEVPIEE